MKSVGIIYNPRILESQPLAEDLKQTIAKRGKNTWLAASREEEEISRHLPGCEMVVTLGGDGTVLRAARIVSQHGLSILAVNLGHLGFLAEVGPEEIQSAMERIEKEEFWVEERMMLEFSLKRNGKEVLSSLALNDVVVGRGSVARAVHLRTAVNGHPLATYIADGIIVATPTGSTAYSLAVGGPVIDPRLKNLLLTPIAPHLSPIGSLILPEDTQLTIEVETDHAASLTIDGQVDVELKSGDQVVVKKSEHLCRLLRVQPPDYFYRTLQERLKFRAL